MLGCLQFTENNDPRQLGMEERNPIGMGRSINSIIFAPSFQAGGVKSLYSVCEWLNDLGRSRIQQFNRPNLATWFEHHCEPYRYSYSPDVLVYPEIYQPYVSGKYHICFALGKFSLIEPHANLVVCKSHEILDWVKNQHPHMATVLILSSINRSVFEYDGRPKKDVVCYMTKPHKHPETAQLLRNKYGDRVREIINFSEAEVAEALKEAKVFVWHGHDKEGSPRPPKEALVAACNVVGLASDLNERYHTNFGIQCSTVDELIHMAGEALKMPLPTNKQRSVIRDSEEEKQDWLALLQHLDIGRGRFSWFRR